MNAAFFSGHAGSAVGLLADLNSGSPDEVFATGMHQYLDNLQSLFKRIAEEIFETHVLMPDKLLPSPTGTSESAFASHAAVNMEAQMQQPQ